MNDQQYIEHEVQIRVMNSELKSIQKNFDDKFELMMKNFDDKLDNRFKSLWSLGILIMGLLMPVFLKSIGVI